MDTNRDKNLLSHVEIISSEAANCNLDFSGIKDKNAVYKVADFLSVTFNQAVLFSCLLEQSFQKMVTFESLSKHMKCSVIKVISLIDEIEALEKKSIIKKRIKWGRKKRSYKDVGYSVPHHVIESLRKSDYGLLKQERKFNLPNLLEQVKFASEERKDDSISTKQLFDEIDLLICNNREHIFIQYLNQKLSNTLSKCISLLLAYYRLTGYINNNIDDVTESVFDDILDQVEFRRSILNGCNELIRKHIVIVERSEFAVNEDISLSQESLDVLFKQFPELKTEEIQKNGVAKPNNIVAKKLFFENELSYKLNDLSNILGKRQFNSFLKSATQSKINRGITAIFHGFSGTGKTEAAYQIAKKTGRHMMIIDLSQSKSKWFGESEKQVKKFFDDYRKLLNNSVTEPILFINEADGLFSKRLNISTTLGNSGQTHNTIQNILLQEMENFEGILIVTTNLTGNMDKAFERRFLFKIEFPKPDKNIRQKIWKYRLPELTNKMAAELGAKFELTGGQIDNMIRKIVIKKVLNKNLNLFETLMDFCKDEFEFDKTRTVGF